MCVENITCTTDGGGTFSRKELASTSWFTMYNSYSLSFGDSLYGIAKFGYQTLFHDIFVTTNSGVNWTGRDLPDSMDTIICYHVK